MESNLPVASEQTNLAVTTMAAKCSGILITNQDDLTEANSLLKGIKGLRLQVDKEFDPGIQEAFAHHRTLVAQKRKWTDPLDQAEKALKPKITSYLLEQDRLAQEAARRDREARDKMQQVADKASDVAYDKIKAGDLDEADEVVAEAQTKIDQIQAARPAPVVKAVASGTSIRHNWKHRVVDASLVPREYLIVDEQALAAVARIRKDQAKVPGVEFYDDPTVATRIDK